MDEMSQEVSLAAPFFLDKSDTASWKALNGLSLKVKEAAEAAGLDTRLIELLNVRISQINGCAFCLDMHSRMALEAEETSQRLAVLSTWRETALFNDLESAALSVAEAATELPDSETRIAELASSRMVLNDAQFSAIQWAAIAMNAFNRVSILSQHPVRPSKK
ncbi:carboxymuconolactone decarboxylase family protein [Paeniglutamicibacter gangotriensis]|uniref:Alkylhydroperoxidase n=1 Tax=Paeniglutamicibacter gangotriensis Lz1y TaxID=1276920 RepID=M7NFC3_9MICC|nr:alkylhydroperoxidase [Paeniglutamicibacter gangotriensis Lz1y]